MSDPSPPFASDIPVKGIETVHLNSLTALWEFIETRPYRGLHSLSRPKWIWRGQRDAEWPLTSSLHRYLHAAAGSSMTASAMAPYAKEILDRFKAAARGRRGTSPRDLTEIEWWALGQHHGLPTPLLDWTYSPFAAAFFAYQAAGETPVPGTPERERAVWALNINAIKQLSLAAQQRDDSPDPIGPLDVFDLLSDDNARLISQGGLFTRTPLEMSVDDWVRTACPSRMTPALYCLKLSGSRPHWLRGLSMMNISSLTLFPDLTGAAAHVVEAIAGEPFFMAKRTPYEGPTNPRESSS